MMTNKIEVAVYMPDEQAKKFLLFQEYYDLFKVMIDSGVFMIRNGEAVLHFDENGTLQVVDRNDHIYHRRHQ